MPVHKNANSNTASSPEKPLSWRKVHPFRSTTLLNFTLYANNSDTGDFIVYGSRHAIATAVLGFDHLCLDMACTVAPLALVRIWERHELIVACFLLVCTLL